MWRSFKTSFALLLPHRVRIVHPNHKRIARGLLYTLSLSLAVKGVTAAKEMALAWRYGTSVEVDAYLISLTLATFLPGIIVGVGTLVFVPLLVRSADLNPVFVAELNGMAIMIGIIMMALTALFGPAVAAYIMPRMDSQALVREMIRLLSPLALFTILAGLLSTRLQAKERFGYTFAEAMLALGILIFIFLWPSSEAPEKPLIWGTLAGTVLQVIVLGRMIYQADGGWGSVAINYHAPQWAGLLQSTGIWTLGSLIAGLAAPIDQIFAAQIGPGAIATLGYANRIIAFVTTLGALALSRVLLPVLSDVAARREYALGQIQTVKWAGLMFVVSGMVVPIGWALAPWCIRLLFERGAFMPEDTAVVSHLLHVGLLQLPFYTASTVLTQWLIVRNRSYVLLIVAVLMLLSKIGFNALLVPSYSTAGLMVSTVGSYVVLWGLLMIYIRTDRARTDP